MLPLLLLLAAAPAHAIETTLSATGGWDFSTAQPWAGVQAALHPDGAEAWAPTARITPAYGFGDRGPLGLIELGITRTSLYNELTPVRFGLIVRGTMITAPYRMPIELQPCPRDNHLGIIPALLGSVEFEYGTEKLFIFGFQGGFTSTASDFFCDPYDDDQSDCLAWYTGFTGGFYLRGKIGEVLYLEGFVGPNSQLSVGAAF